MIKFILKNEIINICNGIDIKNLKEGENIAIEGKIYEIEKIETKYFNLDEREIVYKEICDCFLRSVSYEET